MREDVFENPIEVRTAVPSPHFDDRRVVQRAQPVVPLDEIRTRLRWRKFLYLGGAFAIAMVLGAASALIAVHVKRSSSQVSQIQLTNNTEPETETTETAAVVEATPEPSPAVEESPTDTSTDTEVVPVISAVKKQRPHAVARENVPAGPDTRGVTPSEAEQLEQIRDAVLYERWQERRARRVERREQRRNRGDRDLSEVDEIFEGRRRRQDRPY